LVLADSLLELGDLRGSAAAINGLLAQSLNLIESLNLLRVQTDYLARICAWGLLMQDVDKKVELTELMPGIGAGRTLALLALAAKKTDQKGWEDFLRRRAALLVDVPELIQWRSTLAELWDPI
jgi:hypothetical protein